MNGHKTVMFVLDSFWPNQDGVSTVVQYLSEGLVDKGYHVCVLANAKGRDLSAKEEHNGVIIRRMNIETRWPLYYRAMDANSSVQDYRNAVIEYAPDVIIIESLCSWSNDWFLTFADKLHCRKVLHLHSDITDYHKCGWREINYKVRNIGNILYQMRMQYKARKYWKEIGDSLSKYDTLLYLTDVHTNVMKMNEKGICRVEKLENAVDDIFFDESMSHTNVESNVCRFLCVANYMERKNQRYLLEAYRRATFQSETELIIVGNGSKSYMEGLQRYAKEIIEEDNTYKNIVFYRGITREEILKLYRTSQIFVLSAIWEESPIVIREAAACGMPVISTNVGDVSTIEGCRIVHSVDEMASAMAEYERDLNLRSKQGRMLRDWAMKHCRRSAAVDRLEQLINEEAPFI